MENVPSFASLNPMVGLAYVELEGALQKMEHLVRLLFVLISYTVHLGFETNLESVVVKVKSVQLVGMDEAKWLIGFET